MKLKGLHEPEMIALYKTGRERILLSHVQEEAPTGKYYLWLSSFGRVHWSRALCDTIGTDKFYIGTVEF
jgi:hypothetical protein